MPECCCESMLISSQDPCPANSTGYCAHGLSTNLPWLFCLPCLATSVSSIASNRSLGQGVARAPSLTESNLGWVG